MAQFPALPLWTDAYLADTTDLTTVEHGAYLLLLMAMWRAGGRLPNNDRKLARLAKLTPQQWARVKESIWGFFDEEGDWITQGRLTDELNVVKRRSNRQSAKARARWLKNKETDNAAALPWQSHDDASHTHTHTHTQLASSEASDAREVDRGEGAALKPVDMIRAVESVICELWAIPTWSPTSRSQEPAPDTAQRWIDGGVTPEQLRELVRPALQSLRDRGERYPSALSYLDGPVQEAVEANRQAKESASGGVSKHQWSLRVNGWRNKGLWLTDWGPPPDDPRCEAPADLVETEDRQRGRAAS